VRLGSAGAGVSVHVRHELFQSDHDGSATSDELHFQADAGSSAFVVGFCVRNHDRRHLRVAPRLTSKCALTSHRIVERRRRARRRLAFAGELAQRAIAAGLQQDRETVRTLHRNGESRGSVSI
jgi:hypothetical protein